MGWLTAVSLGFLLIGMGVLIATVLRHLEPQPEYPLIMYDGLRIIGAVIIFGTLVTGTYFLAYGLWSYGG